jgi:threonine dehydrogenase-like Zn-dependent dehydrogenase
MWKQYFYEVEKRRSMLKAIRITEPGMAEVVEIDMPVLRADEVLVRSRAVGLNESDVEGMALYPVIPGHEWAGEVIAIGDVVQDIQPGARVVIESILSCGVCARCRQGQTNLCQRGYQELGFTRTGGLAEYVAVPARLIHVLSDTVPYDEMTLLAPAAIVAHAFLRAQPRPDDVIVVVGDGIESLLAVQFARLFQPHALILLGFREDRLALARGLGATHTVNMSREEPQEVFARLSAGRGANMVFEGTGHAQAMEEACHLACPGGSVLFAGMLTTHTPMSFDSNIIVNRQLSIYGVFGANSAAWDYAIRLFQHGTLQLAPLISHRFTLDEYQDAFDALILRQAQTLKAVITFPTSD